MIVTTEHGRYRIAEEGRGQFRVTILECDDSQDTPCQTGRFSFHSGVLSVGTSGLVAGGITLRVGEQFVFSGARQYPDPCCGQTNRITAIDP